MSDAASVSVPRIDRRADAQPDRNVLAADFEFACRRFEQTIGDFPGSGGSFIQGQDKREFVAAHAGDEGLWRRSLQTPGDGAQELVAGRVPEDVVGLLEMIEVDAEHGKAGMPCSRPLERRGQVRSKRRSVRQTGKRIVVREMRDLLVPRHEFGARYVHVLARFVQADGRPPSPCPGAG